MSLSLLSLSPPSVQSKCSLERRLSSSQQRLAATSDELAKKGAELEGQSQRLAGLQDELSGLQAETAELRDRLSATEEAYREVEGEKTAAEEQNSLLTEKVREWWGGHVTSA